MTDSETMAASVSTPTTPQLVTSSPSVVDGNVADLPRYVEEEPRIESKSDGPSRSVIFDIIKSIRPGASILNISLPAYLLEPRSFLEKPEIMAHCHFLNEAARDLPDPEARFLKVLQWALSAWYLMPKVPKKPSNSILGEMFRSRMRFDDGTEMFEVLEQVSHHPPITAHYGSNRAAGWTIQNTVGFDPVFLGLSVESRFVGGGCVKLTRYENEEYEFSPIPAATASGFIWGPMVFEFTGELTLTCKKSNLFAKVKFNRGTLSGEITREDEKIYHIGGKFDELVTMTSVADPKAPPRTLFRVDRERQPPMKRWVVEPEKLQDNESAKVWSKVFAALLAGDTIAANRAKVEVEEAQRAKAAARKASGAVWEPKLFDLVPETKRWNYKFCNHTTFDPAAEAGETEVMGRILSIPKPASTAPCSPQPVQ